MRPFSPLLSSPIARKKAELPAYGPDGKQPAPAFTKRQERFFRGYVPGGREFSGICLMPLRRRSSC